MKSVSIVVLLLSFMLTIPVTGYSFLLGGEVQDKAKYKRRYNDRLELYKLKQRFTENKRIYLKHYENNYYYIFRSFFPIHDKYEDKITYKHFNVVVASDAKRGELADYICYKKYEIRDFLIDYFHSHPLNAYKGEFNFAELVKPLAEKINKYFKVDVAKYVLIFQGNYSKMDDAVLINSVLPKYLVKECEPLEVDIHEGNKGDF